MPQFKWGHLSTKKNIIFVYDKLWRLALAILKIIKKYLKYTFVYGNIIYKLY